MDNSLNQLVRSILERKQTAVSRSEKVQVEKFEIIGGAPPFGRRSTTYSDEPVI
jgi:hypothetical protein